MKLLHTSDWHLGRMIFGLSLLPDQKYFIRKTFLPLLSDIKPDMVVIAGDVFDRQIASVEAIRLFDSFIHTVHQINIPLAIIAGNHDGADRLAIGAGLLRQSGIYISTAIEDMYNPVSIHTSDSETTDFYLLPYCEPTAIRNYLKNDELRGFSDSYKALFKTLQKKLNPKHINILVAHCFVAGSQVSDSESSLFVGGSGEVSSSIFEGFDYVALGHLHAAQSAGSIARYAGSPLPYSFDEEKQKKSITLLNISKNYKKLKYIPVSPLHNMRTLKGTLDDLISYAKNAPTSEKEDYLYCHILNEKPIYMPAEQLRPYFPNLLGLHCNWMKFSKNKELDELRSQLHKQKVDKLYVFDQFLQQICGETENKEKEELFIEILQQLEKDIL